MAQKRKPPKNIPPTATFIEEWNEWGDGARDANGKYTGPWKFWRPDGSYAEASHFQDGVLHGEKRRFYEDGQVSLVDELQNGVLMTRTTYRPVGETADAHDFKDLSADVVSVEYSFTDDGWFQSQKLLDANGQTLASDGTKAPPRPAGLPPTAGFYTRPATTSTYRTANSFDNKIKTKTVVHPSDLFWQAVEWNTGPDGEVVYRGLCQEFSLEGVRRWIKYEDEFIKDQSLSAFPLVEAAKKGDGRAVEAAWLAGVQHVPGAALQAAIEELPGLAVRIAQAPPGQAPFKPGKPDQWPSQVPRDAIWISKTKTFLQGRLDENGIPIGEVSMWDCHRGSFQRPEHHSMFFFDQGPKAGRLKLRRVRTDDGTRETEYSETSDEVTTRLFDTQGSLWAERVETRSGALVREQRWIDGRRIAEVLPGADEGHERYLGIEGNEIVLEMATTAELHGSPRGDGRVMRQGQQVGVAPFSRFEGLSFIHFSKQELAPFAPKLMQWAALPTPEVLHDLVDLDWPALPGWFSIHGASRQMPFLLTGLGIDDDAVFEAVFNQLANDVEHQGTLSSLTAPVVAGLLRLLPALTPPRQASVLDLVHDCWCIAEDELGDMMVRPGRTLAQEYFNARPAIEALAAEHEEAAELLEWVQAEEKMPQGRVAKIQRIEDLLERCEWVLEKGGSLSAAEFEQLLGEASEPLFRTVLAVESAKACGLKAPPGTLPALHAAVVEFDALSAQMETLENEARWNDDDDDDDDEDVDEFDDDDDEGDELEIFEGGLLVMIAAGFYHAVRYKDHDAASRAASALLSLRPRLDPRSLPTYMDALLALTFSDCELPFAKPFMTVLETLASQPLRDMPGFNEEVPERLANFGLPKTNEAFDKLMMRLRASTQPDVDLQGFMHKSVEEDDEE